MVRMVRGSNEAGRVGGDSTNWTDRLPTRQRPGRVVNRVRLNGTRHRGLTTRPCRNARKKSHARTFDISISGSLKRRLNSCWRRHLCVAFLAGQNAVNVEVGPCSLVECVDTCRISRPFARKVPFLKTQSDVRNVPGTQQTDTECALLLRNFLGFFSSSPGRLLEAKHVPSAEYRRLCDYFLSVTRSRCD